MSFGIMAGLFVVCTVGAVIFFSLYRKRKKPLYSILAVISALLSLAALVYCGLVLIMVTAAQR
ncbi:MAG: hypothetical protein ACOX3H_00140 [Saccharofermentanales bacterium]|jgi:NADH:ubiquinone oxidoreductase subunit 6 (subunit J)